MSKSTPAFQH
ncbi:hypothetical protein cypCar_00042712 [Cyprinus carpio]|nr:hypothetical protein cypCar_00042712 [Cyprinus carpio]